MFYDSVRFIQILNKTRRGPKGPYSQKNLVKIAAPHLGLVKC